MTDRHPATTTVGDQLVARRTRAAAHRRERFSAHPCRTDRRRRRRDGHDVAGRRSGARRLRGPRRLQRDPQRHPARRGARHPPRLLRGGRGRRRDEHVRGEPAQPRRVRHSGADPRARREGHGAGPRGGRRAVDTRPAALRARLGRTRHEAADAGPRDLRPPPRRLRRVRPRPGRGRGRRDRRRDLPGPPAGQGGHPGRAPGDGRRGPPGADRGAGRRRDHRHDAARLRDRRRAHRAGGARRRPHRAELLHRARRDERAPAHPVQARAHPAVGDAQRRAARARPERRRVPAHPRRAGRGAHRVRQRVRGRARRRLLRHHARAHRDAGRGDARPGAPRTPPPPRTGGQLALRPRALPAGHVGAHGRRADQRQRVQEVPRGHAGRGLGGVRRHRARADPRGRAPDRPVRRLRGPRRRGRHGGAGRAPRDGVHAAGDARLHRARGAARGPGAPRRPFDHQLGELRGRRRARLAVPAGDGAGGRARRRRRRALHRRGGPGPHRGVEGPGGRAAHRRPHGQPRHARVRHRRRHAHLPDHHRAGGGASRRAGDHRGDPRAQAPPSRRADHAGRLERLVRAQRRRAAGAELGVPARVRERGPRHRDRVGREDPADGQDPRRAALRGARPGLRPPPRGLRPAQPVHGAVRGRLGVVGQGGAGRGAGRVAAVRAAGAADRRRRAARTHGGPRRGAASPGPRWRSSTTPCWRA